MRTSTTITAVWLMGRVAVLAGMLSNPRFATHLVASDIRAYANWWVNSLSRGAFPFQDTGWQYPPGAAVPVVAVGLVADTDLVYYLYAFAVLVLGADLVAHVLLLRRPVVDGAWYWALVPPLLGTLWFTRIDVIVTVFAVAALLLCRRPLAAGLLLGAGALVKAWPLFLLCAFRRGRSALHVGLVVAAVVLHVLTWVSLAVPGTLSFLAHQRDRGLEVEAVAATPFVLQRLSGGGPDLILRYGSWELVGPFVDIALLACLLATLAGASLLGVWWWRSSRHVAVPCDAALSIVLVVMVTSKVLSPQYFIWTVGLAAVCLAHSGTTQRPVALLIAVCCGLTQLEFPLLWNGIHERDALAAGVLALRNALLLIAAVWSAARLIAAPRRGVWRQAPAFASSDAPNDSSWRRQP